MFYDIDRIKCCYGAYDSIILLYCKMSTKPKLIDLILLTATCQRNVVNLKNQRCLNFFTKPTLVSRFLKVIFSVFLGGKRYDVILKKENVSRVHCRVTKMKYLKKNHGTFNAFSKDSVVTIKKLRNNSMVIVRVTYFLF